MQKRGRAPLVGKDLFILIFFLHQTIPAALLAGLFQPRSHSVLLKFSQNLSTCNGNSLLHLKTNAFHL